MTRTQHALTTSFRVDGAESYDTNFYIDELMRNIRTMLGMSAPITALSYKNICGALHSEEICTFKVNRC